MIVLLVGAALAGFGLTNHKFWDDEANTALFARNLLRFHELIAWDGVNLIGYRGGMELDESLRNTFMPPLQYYVAAASLWLFGETTFAARLPFVLAGIGSLWIIALWVKRHINGTFPSYLPALLLALSPAYLLFIRQARYYSLGVLLSFCLLLVWSSLSDRRRSLIGFSAIGVLCTAGLLFTSYLNAASLLAVLPLFLIHRRYRSQAHFIFLGAIYLTAAIVGAYILYARNPFAVGMAGADPTPALERFGTLLWWNFSALGAFELIPIIVTPILLLPYVLRRLETYRELSKEGLLILAIILTYILVTALFAPTNTAVSDVADARYIVPLIAFGGITTAICLLIIWRLWKPLAILLGGALIFSNVLYLRVLEGHSVRCTFCAYLEENANDYTTGTEALIDYLETLPSDTPVWVRPDFMMYPAMFYVPNLRYCWQLKEEKTLLPEMAALLPDYIYEKRTACPKIMVLGGERTDRLKAGFTLTVSGITYQLDTILPTLWMDRSRPEIAWHLFRPVSESLNQSHGFVVLKRVPESGDWYGTR